MCVWINTAKYLYKHPCVCCNFSYFDFLTLVERLSGKKIFQLIITEMKKLYTMGELPKWQCIRKDEV